MNSMEFVNEPDAWKSYASFFSYLMNQEGDE